MCNIVFTLLSAVAQARQGGKVHHGGSGRFLQVAVQLHKIRAARRALDKIGEAIPASGYTGRAPKQRSRCRCAPSRKPFLPPQTLETPHRR